MVTEENARMMRKHIKVSLHASRTIIEDYLKEFVTEEYGCELLLTNGSTIVVFQDKLQFYKGGEWFATHFEDLTDIEVFNIFEEVCKTMNDNYVLNN